jgi:hypothetical protein
MDTGGNRPMTAMERNGAQGATSGIGRSATFKAERDQLTVHKSAGWRWFRSDQTWRCFAKRCGSEVTRRRELPHLGSVTRKRPATLAAVASARNQPLRLSNAVNRALEMLLLTTYLAVVLVVPPCCPPIPERLPACSLAALRPVATP